MWNPFKSRDISAPQHHPAATLRNGEFLSVVVVVYRMSRFAQRTLHSLSPLYQRGISRDQYEVIVVENDSDDVLPKAFISNLPKNFRYTLIKEPHHSPVFAMNQGLREARGTVVGALIDGARMVTPGLLRKALEASRTHPRAVVSTMGWYLGCDAQNEALAYGYTPKHEDQLLKSINWPQDGYRLFEISVPDLSCTDGWTAPMRESNAIFLHRQTWDQLGGFCEQFTSKGAGIANLDLFKRACELPGAHHVLLNDEATFHQSHGGVASGATPEQLLANIEIWQNEYQRIRGKPFGAPAQHERVLYGAIRDETITPYRNALMHPLRARFDGAWKLQQYPEPTLANPVRGIPPAPGQPRFVPTPDMPAYVQRAVDLVQSLFSERRYPECRDVCRLMLSRVGHGKVWPIERVLASCSNVWVDPNQDQPARQSRHLSAMGRAHHILGEFNQAEKLYLQALELNFMNNEARGNLSTIRLPGDSYFLRLLELHRQLKPKIYLEIGVCEGESIQLAKPPTLAFGVDPKPRLLGQYSADTRIYPILSDDFFARHRKENLIPGPIDFGFIDGSHEFLQVVRDFWNVERLCASSSVIALHDTLPLDAHSSQKTLVPDFWTGDVWKILPFLHNERPDLKVVTITAPPSGLTLVTGLRPTHPMSLEQALKRASAYDGLTFDDFVREWSGRIERLGNTSTALSNYLIALTQGESCAVAAGS